MLSPEKIKEDRALLQHWESNLETVFNIIQLILRELKQQNLNSEFNEEIKKNVYNSLKNAGNNIDFGLSELAGYSD